MVLEPEDDLEICPICGDDFIDCGHTFEDVDVWEEEDEVEDLIHVKEREFYEEDMDEFPEAKGLPTDKFEPKGDMWSPIKKPKK